MNLISNGSEACLRQPQTRGNPCKSGKGSSLCREDCFGQRVLSAGTANLLSRDLTCEDFKELSSSGILDRRDDCILLPLEAWPSYC